MKNKFKLATFTLIAYSILCGSLKAQQNLSFSEYGEQMSEELRIKRLNKLESKRAEIAEQREQELIQKAKQRKENIQTGLIIGGILVFPLLIVSTTLFISKVRENKYQQF